MKTSRYVTFEITKLFLIIFRQIYPIAASLMLGMILLTGNCKAQKTTDVPKWTVYEIALGASDTYDNPYVQASATATFTGPGNLSKTVKDFWNGDSTFILRFTPTAEGVWSYKTVSEDEGLNGKTGQINCMAPVTENHGFLRRNANHPYHFIYDYSVRYFMFGTTYYEILANAADTDRWKQSFDGIIQYGII